MLAAGRRTTKPRHRRRGFSGHLMTPRGHAVTHPAHPGDPLHLSVEGHQIVQSRSFYCPEPKAPVSTRSRLLTGARALVFRGRPAGTLLRSRDTTGAAGAAVASLWRCKFARGFRFRVPRKAAPPGRNRKRAETLADREAAVSLGVGETLPTRPQRNSRRRRPVGHGVGEVFRTTSAAAGLVSDREASADKLPAAHPVPVVLRSSSPRRNLARARRRGTRGPRGPPCRSSPAHDRPLD